MCKHMIVVDGFGGMGDALICVECGLCKYPEVFPFGFFASIFGRVVGENEPGWDELSKKALAMRKLNYGE